MSAATKNKVTSKVKRAIGKVVNDANKSADKLEEQGVPKEVTRLIRPVLSQVAADAVDTVNAREKKIERAKALYNNGYSFQEIAETLGVAESTVRKYVADGDELIDLNGLSTLTLRIREYKRDGLSNVAIGQRVGVSESTVRRRLKTPLTEEETFLELMLDRLGDARDEIIQDLISEKLFTTLFGDHNSEEDWILRINTIKRRAGFTRREGKGQRMTFTLEFSAYRQPLSKNVDN